MFFYRFYFLTWVRFLCSSLLKKQAGLVGVILFYLSGPAVALEQCLAGDYSEPFHICYFSLNNEKEFVEMQKFTNKINQHTLELVSVQEYLTEGELPEESFKKMVESGVRCDGLIISGHHTSTFKGKRSSGSLSIDFLETLSCDPKYSKWFTRVNALWLQGCRTLGTGEIIVEESSANYHTMQVEEILEEDYLEQSIAQLNIEFSATLDQDNPLSSRYLRIFPGATVFGWTKVAPGEKAGSQYSIPFHIAHISKLISHQDAFPSDSPIQGAWTKESTLQYLNSIIGVLDGSTQCQDLAVEAWKEHGKVQNQTTEYGFYNPALNAYKPLTETDGTILKTAHVYDCLFKNSQGQQFLKVLDEILKEPILIRYTYNSLLERLKTLKAEDPNLYTQTINKLRSNMVIQDFLSKKLDDKNLGLLRKIDYFVFYEEIFGPTQKIIPTILKKVSQAFYNISSETPDGLDYKRTLLASLAKHGCLNNDQGLQLIQQVVEEDPRKEMKVFAIEVAGELGELALFILEEGFSNSNAHVRAVALTQLRQQLEKEALLPFVEEGITDKSPYVRAMAMGSAPRLEEAGPILEKGFLDDTQWVRASAIKASLQIGEKALPFLKKTLATKEGNQTLVDWPKALPMLKKAKDQHKDKEFRNYIQSLISYVEQEQKK